MMEVKPGYKTTEFWMSMIGMAGIAFGIPVTPEVQVAGVAFLGGMYNLTRGIAKHVKGK